MGFWDRNSRAWKEIQCALMRSRVSKKLFGIVCLLFERSEFCHAQIAFLKRGNRKGKHGMPLLLVRFLWANKENERPRGSEIK